MKKAENTRIRIFLAILLGCAAVILYFLILHGIQINILTEQFRKEMEKTADYLKESYPDAEDSANDAAFSEVDLYEQSLNLLCEFQQAEDDFEISDSYLRKYCEAGDFSDLMIADRSGHVLAAASGKHPDLTGSVYDSLRDTFRTGEICSLRLDREEMKGEPDRDDPDMPEGDEWYTVAFDKEHEFILCVYNWIQRVVVPEMDAWKRLLENMSIGEEGFVFVWSDETNELLYYPETSLSNHSVETLGLDPDEIRDREYSCHSINGRKVYLYTTLYGDKGAWIACAVPESELNNSLRFTVIVFSIAFALLVTALEYYVILLLRQKRVKILRDFTGEEKNTKHKSRQYKLLILTIVMTVILFLFQFYLQTLYLMSSWAEAASLQTNRIEETVHFQEDTARSYTELYENEKKGLLNMLALYLASHPEHCVSSELDELSFMIRAYDIEVLDREGTVLAAASSMAYQSPLPVNAAGSKTDSAESMAETFAAQDNGKSVYEWMSEGRTVILPMTDHDGTSTGFLFVRYYSYFADVALQSLSLSGTLSRIRPGNGGFVFSVDPDTKKFSYYPDEVMVGRDALEYGLTENQIKDNFCDFITINGSPYFAVTDVIGTNVIYYCVSRNALLGRRIVLCMLSVLSAAILLLLTGLPLYTSREQIELVQPDEGRHTIREDQSSPEYRTIRVLKYYTVAAAALIAAYCVFRQNTGSGGVIGYVLDGKWERGLNVFALFSAIMILSRGGLILFVFSRLAGIVSSILPVRGGTILKMVGSLVTYLAVGYLIYQCMVCFGMNPTALMASAGIVSVVVGIGANSLVGDILAGIFLLMEGNVQVGDVVQIGDFRGYVMEMGIRMTKLFDMDMDDVKIIPNNEVRNVVHMTMRTSIVYSEFQIRYEEKLESVEKILREELKNVQNKSPLILDGPVYIGVEALDSSGVVLKTATRCHEPCRRKVEREVNHIVYSIFQKNGISVPYPQVTIHEGNDAPVER